jgi:protein O-GlcNAc transferase
MTAEDVLKDEMLELNRAIALHRTGQYEEAMKIYQALLNSKTLNIDAMHLIANVYKDKRQYPEALMWVNRAITLRPHQFFYNTRGAIFSDMKRYADAINDLNRSYKLQPDNYELLVNLCGAHRASKNYRKALEFGQKATNLNAQADMAWVNLGCIAVDQGKSEEAVGLFEAAIQRNENNAFANLNLGKLKVSQNAQDMSDDLLALFRRAAELSPYAFEPQVRYAAELVKRKQMVEAVDPLVKALDIGKKLDFKAMTQDNEMLGTFFQVSNILKILNKENVNEKAYKRLLEVAPDTIIFWTNLALAYVAQNNLAEAEKCYAKALEMDEHNFHALNGRAMLFVNQVNIAGAVADLEHIRRYRPHDVGNLSWLFAEKMHGAMWEGVERIRAEILSLGQLSKDNAINTFIMLSLTDRAEVQHANALVAAEQVETPYLDLKASKPIRKNAKTARIKIGYVSNDFRQHPLGVLASELFTLHDRKRFEVTAYNYSADDGSQVRKRIQSTAERWVDMTQQTILEMADNIRSDGCEILVDLTCNTRGGRPQLMCLRPAPVQGAWMGFVGTMGSKHYDLIIADTTVIPEEDFPYYSEKTLRLPYTFQINDPNRVAPRADVKKSELGFADDDIVLCSFNQAYKTQPGVFNTWIDILRRAPRAKLWLLEDNKWATETWRKMIAQSGLQEDRLVIGPRMPPAQHLERYVMADLALDTYPVNSGATASDALFAGCPILTHRGHSMVSRMCSSLLKATHLEELITTSWQSYADKAVELINAPERLAAMKTMLLSKRDTLPLFDAPMLIRDLEKGYSEIARMIRSDQPLDHVTVQPSPRSSECRLPKTQEVVSEPGSTPPVSG